MLTKHTWFGIALGTRRCAKPIIWGGVGAPPPPMARSDDTSAAARPGHFSSSMDIAGTPLNIVTRSRSMSRSASATSHLYLQTKGRSVHKDGKEPWLVTLKTLRWVA